MRQHRVDRLAVAVHHVEDARGQARLREQLRQQHGRGRVALGRLQQERVPAGERDREHPHRDHGGEVERRDPGRDPERLADGEAVDAVRHVLAEAALQQLRQAAGELDHLQAARDLAARVRQHLAVLAGEAGRERLRVARDQVAEREQHLRAAPQRGVAPAGERARRRVHRAVERGRVGERHLRLPGPGRGVPDVAPARAALGSVRRRSSAERVSSWLFAPT